MTTSNFYAEALKSGRPIFAVAPMIDWMFFLKNIKKSTCIFRM